MISLGGAAATAVHKRLAQDGVGYFGWLGLLLPFCPGAGKEESLGSLRDAVAWGFNTCPVPRIKHDCIIPRLSCRSRLPGPPPPLPPTGRAYRS